MLPQADLPSGRPFHAHSIDLLNRHLAAAIDLRGQIKHACRNLRGPDAVPAYGPLDRAAAAIEHYADLIACQVVELGGGADLTVQAAATRSFLAPYLLGTAGVCQHARAVAGALERFCRSLRRAGTQAADFGDAGTAVLLLEMAGGLDRLAAGIDRLTGTSRRPPHLVPIAPHADRNGATADWPTAVAFDGSSPADDAVRATQGWRDPVLVRGTGITTCAEVGE